MEIVLDDGGGINAVEDDDVLEFKEAADEVTLPDVVWGWQDKASVLPIESSPTDAALWLLDREAPEALDEQPKRSILSYLFTGRRQHQQPSGEPTVSLPAPQSPQSTSPSRSPTRQHIDSSPAAPPSSNRPVAFAETRTSESVAPASPKKSPKRAQSSAFLPSLISQSPQTSPKRSPAQGPNLSEAQVIVRVRPSSISGPPSPDPPSLSSLPVRRRTRPAKIDGLDDFTRLRAAQNPASPQKEPSLRSLETIKSSPASRMSCPAIQTSANEATPKKHSPRNLKIISTTSSSETDDSQHTSPEKESDALPVCASCSKHVYPTNATIDIDDAHVVHRGCFRCERCHERLTLANFHRVETESDAHRRLAFVCTTHYVERLERNSPIHPHH